MCGICGLVGDNDPVLLERMLARLIHRGPDDEGMHSAAGVALGARRLRVIDPRGGHQPVRNESGSVWAVLNGEIYNYRELREELIRKGHRFQSDCDTEVLVHLYEEEGPEGVYRLRGMFAYAIWDRERELVLLVRDRLGIKPLYYSVQPGHAGAAHRVLFSSELPSLLEGLPDWRIRPQAIADFLSLLYVPGPDTLVEGVYQLRPGEALKIVRGRLEFWRYYRPEEEVLRQVEFQQGDQREQFRSMLRDSVQAHLISDVPLGLFLSGGLDSASILACMREVIPGSIKTFSIGYEAPEDQSYNELKAARLLATHFGTDHTEALLRPDAVSLLPRVVAGMGEPFADSSAIPTYLVSEVARQSVTVALSGIGGDELFGGYPRYLGIRAAAQYAALPVAMRTWFAARAESLSDGSGSRNALGRIKRFLLDGNRPLHEQYLRWTTFQPAGWDGPLLADGLRMAVADRSALHNLGRLFDQWPSDEPADRAMGVDLQTYLPDDLLRMGDRMSMAHSLELRVPFCDHHLLAFACSLPAATRLQGWKLKGFMRSALRDLLPSSIVSGPKRGFMLPLGRWLREDLREMSRDLLSDEAIRRRGYVDPSYVQWLLAEHQSGRRNFTDQIYALMVLELWHRQVAQPVSNQTMGVGAA
ncbi:MAG: asparagine synthase (glutamine-hydrolyzing) [Nitrospirota bacterium]|nr:asparagine synthase (glutamine-hydrolyzing) [Nitrospirota bacterium]MDP3596327.1 asparagine synthase (glutamine-hydrolyzing) [Nitrospirota bacterium]